MKFGFEKANTGATCVERQVCDQEYFASDSDIGVNV
jgi:hypothetical protein